MVFTDFFDLIPDLQETGNFMSKKLYYPAVFGIKCALSAAGRRQYYSDDENLPFSTEF